MALPRSKGVDITTGVCAVVAVDGRIAGTAFYITETLALTCLHVVRDALGRGPRLGDMVSLEITHLRDHTRWQRANVTCLHEADDVCVLELAEAARRPPGTIQLPLGAAIDTDDHAFRSYGYPDIAGHYALQTRGAIRGDGRAGILLLSGVDAAVTVTSGFSGAPVFDLSTSTVVGMISRQVLGTAVARGTGLAVPIDIIREVCEQVSRVPPPSDPSSNDLKKQLKDMLNALRAAIGNAFIAARPANPALLPNVMDAVESERVGDHLAAYFAAWSTTHRLNRAHPEDGDFFYVVSFEGQRADFADPAHFVATIAVEWSERGVLRANRPKGRSIPYLIARWAKAAKTLEIDGTVDEGDWSGLQIRTTQFVSTTQPEEAAHSIVAKLLQMAMDFDLLRRTAARL